MRDEVHPGAVVTVSTFICERCYDKRISASGPKDFLDYTVLPVFLIRHIRCHYCGDRYATFGFGKERVVFSRGTTRATRKVAVVVLCAALVAGVVTLIFLR